MDLQATRNQLRQRNLRAFRIVCETGSATRAAERLALSQPAVSQLIARFEEAIGLKLFVHGMGRRLQPTPFGRVLYVDVCRVLDAMANLEATAATLCDEGPRAGPRRWDGAEVPA